MSKPRQVFESHRLSVHADEEEPSVSGETGGCFRFDCAVCEVSNARNFGIFVFDAMESIRHNF